MASPSPTPQPSTHSTLRQKTTQGVMWGVTLSIVMRCVGLLTQLALVWLLQKQDFGLMGLAYTVTAFINLLANPGIDAVLVQRNRKFHLWATPAFWMGMATGTLGMLATLAAAPVAAAIYGKPELVGLLAIMALAMPLQTLQIVPKAQLQGQLRFRTTMQLAFIGNLTMALLTILCAWLGFGAYSFAVPVPITAGIMAAAWWRTARPHVRMTPHLNRWKYVLGDSLTMASAKVMLHVVGQGDFIVLGLFHFSSALVGVYFFAFNIAIQPFRLIANSIETVLFPSLSQASLDPAQQVRAMMRATRLLAFVIVPACTLQILLAWPLFRLIVPDRWLDAVTPLQILSIAVMFSSLYWPSLSLMMAQRRFGEYFRLTVVKAVTFFSLVGAFVWFDRRIEAAAVGVATWAVLSSPFIFWVSAGRSRSPLAYLNEVYRPFVASLGAALPCMILLNLLPDGAQADVVALVAGAFMFAAVYLLLVRLIAAKDFHDLLVQVSPVLKKLGIRIPLFEVPSAKRDSLP